MTQLYVRAQLAWSRVLSWTRNSMGDERGATVAEYALVLVLIAVALIAVLGDLGDALRDRIEDVIEKLPVTP